MQRIFAGLAMASFMLLGIGAARADDCSTQYPGPVNVNGDFIVNVNGDCTLSSVTATGGQISITSNTGKVTTGALQGDNGVLISAQTNATVASAISSAGGISIFSYTGDTNINGSVTAKTGYIGVAARNHNHSGATSSALLDSH